MFVRLVTGVSRHLDMGSSSSEDEPGPGLVTGVFRHPDLGSSSSEDEPGPGPARDPAPPPPALAPALAPALVYSSSEEEEGGAPRSRIRARRVLPRDLVTTEGAEPGEVEDSTTSSSDTDEDGTPSSTYVSDKAREVLFKPISRPRHSLVADLAARQLGLRLRPSFTERRCASADLVRRFKLVAKLSGHEGCVNCLNFNQVLDPPHLEHAWPWSMPDPLASLHA